MIRAFLALDLDDAFLDEARRVQERLAPRLPRARWTNRDLMHVTARFLGDVEEAIVPALCLGTSEIVARYASASREGLEAHTAGLHAFPDARRAKVLVVSLADQTGALAAIAKDCEALAVRLGLPPEGRPFHAHLTLARMREPTDVRALLTETPMVGRVTSLTLYRSELGKGQGGSPLYTPLARAAL